MIMENKNPKQEDTNVDSLKQELDVVKAEKEKLERELIAREELMQSMFSLLAERKK
jgi:hypothetical protein